MTQLTHPNVTSIILLCAIIFTLPSLKAQVVIGQPSLGFTKACANNSFNSFETSFSFNPPSALSSSNQFTLELSDANGNFSDPVEVYVSQPGEIITSPATVSFTLPSETGGENYKIRIKSSAPSASSVPSQAFPAYFKLHDTPFTINGLVDTGTFCPASGYLLSIDNPGFDGAISPLTFDSLNFNWFRAVSNTSSVLVGQGETFLVFEEGVYFAETAYGSCSSDSFSNRVTIAQATSGEPANAVITSSLGNSFCSDGEGTILSTVAGDTFQWFKDDVLIDNASSSTLQTAESGNYAVIVRSGDCVAVGSLLVENIGGSIALNVGAINYVEDGESLSVSVDTEINGATYQWYFNEEIIAGAQSDSFTASQIGKYKVNVSASGSCNVSTELSFELKLRVNIDTIPNTISPNGDGINEFWTIPAEYLSGTGTEVSIFSSTGEEVLNTKDYLNNWPDDSDILSTSNQVFYYLIQTQDNEVLKGSLTLIR